MANDCCGVIRVVAKDKSVIDRLYNIFNYEDAEYHLYGCRYCSRLDNGIEEYGFWRSDFEVCGRYACSPFFYEENDENKLLIKEYPRKADGSFDTEHPIFGTSHITNLSYLSEELGFGCELYSEETSCGFCEHFLIDHNGEFVYNEVGDLSEVIPPNKNTKSDNDADIEYTYGIDGYMNFSNTKEIYR